LGDDTFSLSGFTYFLGIGNHADTVSAVPGQGEIRNWAERLLSPKPDVQIA